MDVRVALPATVTGELLDNWSKVGKVKQYKESARFCIVDNKEMLLFLTDDTKVHKSYDCAVWVEAAQFVDYFASLFDAQWKQGK